jgi:hypothetical protein
MNLIIHHWDADGICSAAIIAEILEEDGAEWSNVSPVPGIFEFDERIWSMTDEADRIFVADLNMPESVEKLKKEILFFDHHPQKRIKRENVEHVNPVIHGSHKYQSTTWVVSEYFGRWNHLSVLGLVGDLGRKALYIVEAAGLLEGTGLGKDDVLKLAALIDSPSVVGDRKGVEDAVQKVKDTAPSELLKDAEWNDNLRKAELEIEKVVDGIQVENSIAYAKFSSNFNIISKVARKLVWDLDYDAAFVVNRDYHGYSQVYFRVKSELAEKFRILELIEVLRKSGINAGGKKDVVGIICEPELLEKVVEIVESHIGWKK